MLGSRYPPLFSSGRPGLGLRARFSSGWLSQLFNSAACLKKFHITRKWQASFDHLVRKRQHGWWNFEAD
jgi:hypothetical protein